MQLAHRNSEAQSSGQEDSQMTMIYSPAQSSSQLSSSSNDEEEDETEVVDCWVYNQMLEFDDDIE